MIGVSKTFGGSSILSSPADEALIFQGFISRGEFRVMIQQRNIAVCIILSIVTCGIYGIYWFIVLSNDTNTVSNAENATSGGVAFVLSLITCNIYGLYWAYKQGEKIDKAKTDRGIPSSNSGVIYLILCFVGLGIVAEALMQNELNSLA